MEQKQLRWGYTTGTCAAAASLAAAAMLFSGKRVEQVSVTVPKGVSLRLAIEEIHLESGRASCAVRKDAGDDPDVTDGFLIWSCVEREREAGPEEDCYIDQEDGITLKLRGGTGVGIVTKPGLSCEVGKPAINPVPRRMIWDNVRTICRREGFQGTLCITISIPRGAEAAARTFNPHLGIQGGISVLGTSGLVEPMSERALLETIRLDLRQRCMIWGDRLILTPGNYGEAFLRERLSIDVSQTVKCSNYIGETIDMAAELGVKELLLVGHGGKLIKLAAGIMNTHSSMADGRMEILAAYGAACGAGRDQVLRILEAVSVDQGLAVLEEKAGNPEEGTGGDGLREQTMARIMDRIAYHLERRAGGRLQAEALVFTNERGILGQTPGAGRLLKQLQERGRGTTGE